MDLAYLLRRAAREHPHSVAAEDSHRRVTMGALVRRAESLANYMDGHEVPKGAAIGILSENRVEYVEADVAIALGGRVRVALNPRWSLDEHRFVAEDSNMQMLFHSEEHNEAAGLLRAEFGLRTLSFDSDLEVSPWFEDALESVDSTPVLRPSESDATTWLSYTSGTTGRPKGVELSQRALTSVAFNLLLELGVPHAGEQVVLTQPLSHGAGYFTLPYLLSGAGLYVSRSFDPTEVWEISLRPNVRSLKVVPAMLPPLLEVEGEHWGYETTVYGAAPLPGAVRDQALDRFGPTLVQIYGQTEAPMTLTCLRKEDHLVDAARASAGRPWRTVHLEIRAEGGEAARTDQVGEVYVRADHLMSGYHRQPDATRDTLVDGWLRTRDLARMDERGFVHLEGRVDDMINSGGFNISPREVENVLADHGAVWEAVVVGTPHEKWGNAVTAFIQLKPGLHVGERELIEFTKPRLGIRAPKAIVFVEDFPRTSYGKIDKAALKFDGAAMADNNLQNRRV